MQNGCIYFAILQSYYFTFVLKSPDSTHIVWVGLIVVILVAIEELLAPRDATTRTGFGGTPIVAVNKTTN
jgi:hypothetical protein